jgi:hypothetical protein
VEDKGCEVCLCLDIGKLAAVAGQHLLRQWQQFYKSILQLGQYSTSALGGFQKLLVIAL